MNSRDGGVVVARDDDIPEKGDGVSAFASAPVHVAQPNADSIELSKKDVCVLCFCDIYGAPFEIFGEWRNGALYF